MWNISSLSRFKRYILGAVVILFMPLLIGALFAPNNAERLEKDERRYKLAIEWTELGVLNKSFTVKKRQARSEVFSDKVYWWIQYEFKDKPNEIKAYYDKVLLKNNWQLVKNTGKEYEYKKGDIMHLNLVHESEFIWTFYFSHDGATNDSFFVKVKKAWADLKGQKQ